MTILLQTQSHRSKGEHSTLTLAVWLIFFFLSPRHLSDSHGQVSVGYSVWTVFLCVCVFEALTGTRWVCCSSFPVNPHQAVTAPNTATLFYREQFLHPCWSGFPHHGPRFEKWIAKSQETVFILQSAWRSPIRKETVQPAELWASSFGLLGFRGSSGDLVSACDNSA